MKRSYPIDPTTRTIPPDWIPASSGARVRMRAPYKWMTTLPVPLADVRDRALEALSGIDATLAYLYETEEKVVIRCTLPERQIRAELRPLDPHSTRILVVTMRGTEVDRTTSGRIIQAIEHRLHETGQAGQLPGA